MRARSCPWLRPPPSCSCAGWRGGRAVDWGAPRPSPGETLVVPDNNTNTFLMPRGSVSLLRVVEVPSPALMATMNRAVGAGFYSDVWGPLPFAVGRGPQERYYVFRVTAPPRWRRRERGAGQRRGVTVDDRPPATGRDLRRAGPC